MLWCITLNCKKVGNKEKNIKKLTFHKVLNILN